MRAPVWQPPTDVYEIDDAVIVRIEIAGMREEDFSIEINGRLLSVRGIRLDNAEVRGYHEGYQRGYHRMEIRFGEFSVDLTLPFDVQADQVQAEYGQGFLRILLPKALPRKIPVVD
jgi:HSP20 family protein